FTFLAFLGFFRASTRLELYATTALFAFCRAPLTSLVDATTLSYAHHHGVSYGRIRLWGSLGFLVAVVVGGALVERAGLGARVTSAAAILCLQPLHGVTFGLFWVSAVTLTRDRGHAAPTAAQGLFAAGLGTGSLIGMNLAGRLLEAGGGPLLFGAAAGCAALGTVCASMYANRARL